MAENERERGRKSGRKRKKEKFEKEKEREREMQMLEVGLHTDTIQNTEKIIENKLIATSSAISGLME